MSECLGVPNKMNSSKDIFDARSNDGATMVEKTKSSGIWVGLSVMFPMRFWVALMGVFLLTKGVECPTETSTAL